MCAPFADEIIVGGQRPVYLPLEGLELLTGQYLFEIRLPDVAKNFFPVIIHATNHELSAIKKMEPVGDTAAGEIFKTRTDDIFLLHFISPNTTGTAVVRMIKKSGQSLYVV